MEGSGLQVQVVMKLQGQQMRLVVQETKSMEMSKAASSFPVPDIAEEHVY